MARVLILSSYVAASRVGGAAQALALARLGIEPILIPTTLFGRHPGHGPPGGAPVEPETMEAMLGAVEAQGLFAHIDAVITGHFSSAEQVAIAAGAIHRVREANSSARIVVDPIMGDVDKGLYVREPVAEALAADLVPPADLLAPNAWELARLSGQPVEGVASALAAARAIGRPTLVSSVETRDGLSVLYADRESAWTAAHRRAPAAPNGAGDMLTALFVASLIKDYDPPSALAAAVSGVVEAVFAAAGANELRVDDFPSALELSPRVRMEAVDG
jgi:pyridoxine kinase